MEIDSSANNYHSLPLPHSLMYHQRHPTTFIIHIKGWSWLAPWPRLTYLAPSSFNSCPVLDWSSQPAIACDQSLINPRAPPNNFFFRLIMRNWIWQGGSEQKWVESFWTEPKMSKIKHCYTFHKKWNKLPTNCNQHLLQHQYKWNPNCETATDKTDLNWHQKEAKLAKLNHIGQIDIKGKPENLFRLTVMFQCVPMKAINVNFLWESFLCFITKGMVEDLNLNCADPKERNLIWIDWESRAAWEAQEGWNFLNCLINQQARNKVLEHGHLNGLCCINYKLYNPKRRRKRQNVKQEQANILCGK